MTAAVPVGGFRSDTKRVIELKLVGKDDTIHIPCLVPTTVLEIKEQLAERFGVNKSSIEFLCKQGAYFKKQLDHAEIQSKTIVKGIKSFGGVRVEYKHPHVIVGAGLGGLRMALCLIQGGQEKFAVIESGETLGGRSWLNDANKTSRLQTELGTYHLSYSDKCPVPKGMSVWPSRDDLLRHFNEVADSEGISPHIVYSTEVRGYNIVKDKLDENNRDYLLRLKNRAGEIRELSAASLLLFTGTVEDARTLELKGEMSFGGQVSLGRSSDFKFELVEGKSVVIVGFGSFALENVRSCFEFRARKIYLVCRKKNLVLPRMISWQVNGATHPVASAMLLRHMQPAYSLIGEDPWQQPSVGGSSELADLKIGDINQSTRFPISDVYFLACYFGALECKIADVKRLTEDTVHLDGDEKIENVCAVLKCIGFELSWAADKLLQVKSMEGFWANGDHRLAHWTEFSLVPSDKISWTSHVPPLVQTCEIIAHMVDFPSDFIKLRATGQLPVRMSDVSKELPATYIESKVGAAIIAVICATLPVFAQRAQFHNQFKRQRQLETHSVNEVIEEASAEWQKYSEMFQQQYGHDQPIPAYPYTVQSMWGLIDEIDSVGQQR